MQHLRVAQMAPSMHSVSPEVLSMLRIVAAIAVCLVGQAAFAESEKTAVSTDEFVRRASAAGTAEVEFGRLALEKSGSQPVKAFAQTMVTDHQNANDTLKAIASKDGLTVATAPEPSQKTALLELKDETGIEFDRAFATRMVQDHQDAVTLFQKAVAQPDINPSIRQFAEATLPTLKAHLEHAKQLHSTLGGDARHSER
jgi:putative membrane protein